MSTQVYHASLNTTFLGIEDARYGAVVEHFRGIPYGRIGKRFKKPQAYTSYQSTVDATRFGPQCPQPKIEVGHLLRLPVSARGPEIEEDEFACLNLNISRAQRGSPDSAAPVIVWIHGGSQVVTFASASAPVCDPTRLVAESGELGTSIIVVTFNYRLNIFAFGDSKGEINLALQDQRQLFSWVADNIQGFGGDPTNITLAGESAGAVYAHAHMVSGAAVQRAILASGSLYLSPPLPREFGNRLISRLEEQLGQGSNLQNCTADAVIDALAACNVNSMWLQEEESLVDWKERTTFTQPLLISDVEFESVIWRQGIEDANLRDLEHAFDAAGEHVETLKRLYHFDISRPTQSKLAALDLLNDVRFGLPVTGIYEARHRAGCQTYRYLFDQPNPWQSSSRAHHAVDLISIFGGVDVKFNPGAEAVGVRLRQAWIAFASGAEPWTVTQSFAFGPYGDCKVLTDQEHNGRRRLGHFKRLVEIGSGAYNPVFTQLATGRISLYN